MILFVFEGKKREPALFKTIEKLFFKDSQHIVCSFGNNIYELYQRLLDLDNSGDIVSVLREIYAGRPDSPFSENMKSSDFSEIYLIFDYDFQNRNISLEKMNAQLEEMLNIFSDETDNGKLYINYPMVEAIRYTERLPDTRFHTYAVSRRDCSEESFKNIADSFSDYKSLDFLTLSTKRTPTEKEVNSRKENWHMVKNQNVAKANYLCSGNLSMPESKEDISQRKIFAAQLQKFILPDDSVSILSAFPLFLFEYFPA